MKLDTNNRKVAECQRVLPNYFLSRVHAHKEGEQLYRFGDYFLCFCWKQSNPEKPLLGVCGLSWDFDISDFDHENKNW